MRERVDLDLALVERARGGGAAARARGLDLNHVGHVAVGRLVVQRLLPEHAALPNSLTLVRYACAASAMRVVVQRLLPEHAALPNSLTLVRYACAASAMRGGTREQQRPCLTSRLGDKLDCGVAQILLPESAILEDYKNSTRDLRQVSRQTRGLQEFS